MSVRLCPLLHPLEARLSDVVGGTGHLTQCRRGVSLELRCDSGLRGLGEASPLPNFSEESLEEAESQLSRLGVFGVALPESPLQCRVWIANLLQSSGCTAASARFALEGALVDLCSQHLHLPAASLLASMAGLPTATQRVQLSKLLPSAEMPRLLVAARHAWARGYRTLKIKLGPFEGFEQEYQNLAALREQLPATAKLRLDPNRSWPASKLPGALERLNQLSPELLEEPIPAMQLMGLETSPIALALDESLQEAALLNHLGPHLQRLNIVAVVLKPALLGLLRGLEIAEQARKLQLEVIVTHLFDGPVGHATASSLALAIGSQTFAHGLAPHPGLLLCPERRVQGLSGGSLQLEAQPGLPLAELSTC